MYGRIARVAPEVGLISISENQRRPMPDLPWAATIPNAIDLSIYPCKPHPGEYLLFLGRMSPDKGAHRAIAVAMELGIPLKIAGKRAELKERQYFAELVEPHLGHGVEYLGEVLARREGRAPAGRAGDAVPDRVGGAVRPGDDRVDGVRDAGDRDATRRGARGDRGRAQRDHRRQLPANGGSARARQTRSTRWSAAGTSRSASPRNAWSTTTCAPSEASPSAGGGSLLVPVALEACVGLPERRGSLVVRDALVSSLECRRARPPRTLPRSSPGEPAAPRSELPPQAAQVVARALDDPEVDQREPLGRAALDLVDRPLPGLEVDVRRRRDGEDVARRASIRTPAASPA